MRLFQHLLPVTDTAGQRSPSSVNADVASAGVSIRVIFILKGLVPDDSCIALLLNAAQLRDNSLGRIDCVGGRLAACQR